MLFVGGTDLFLVKETLINLFATFSHSQRSLSMAAWYALNYDA